MCNINISMNMTLILSRELDKISFSLLSLYNFREHGLIIQLVLSTYEGGTEPYIMEDRTKLLRAAQNMFSEKYLELFLKIEENMNFSLT